jgi:hypothetical protein
MRNCRSPSTLTDRSQQAPGPPGRRTEIKKIILAGLVALAVAGCGGSTATTANDDAITGQALASATLLVASGAYGISGGNSCTPIAQVQVQIWGASSGVLSAGFRRDLYAVVGDPSKPGYGNYEPSPQQVSKLQTDCAAFGVKGSVWPSSLTTSQS